MRQLSYVLFASGGILSASRDLELSVAAEIDDLTSEINSVQPLLDKVFVSEPDAIELRALAATLHAFYNGVERIFVLIAKCYNELPTASHTWHRDLLATMATPTEARQAVISEPLRDELSQLLAFRHFFRHAYPMRLKWSLIRPLVKHLEISRAAFVREVQAFIAE